MIVVILAKASRAPNLHIPVYSTTAQMTEILDASTHLRELNEILAKKERCSIKVFLAIFLIFLTIILG